MSSSDTEEESSQRSRGRTKQRRRNTEQDSDDDSSDSGREDTASLNRFSQMLLQAVQAIGIMTSEEMQDTVLEIVKQIGGNDSQTADDITPEFIQKKIDVINQSLNPLNMAIHKVICEVTETTLYMSYATIESPVMKFQTSFIPYEVELFKNITKVILEKEDFMVSTADLVKCANAVKLDNKDKPKTHSKIVKMIDKLIDLQYLVFGSDDGTRTTLGIRTIREMGALLQDMNKRAIGNCCLCKNRILNGLRCGKCNNDFHLHCFKTYIQATTQCPNCKTVLPDLNDMPKRTGTRIGDDSGEYVQGSSSNSMDVETEAPADQNHVNNASSSSDSD